VNSGVSSFAAADSTTIARMANPRQRVLFLCTGNSCRSQMAEGLLRHLGGERFEALSAGANPAGFVHRLAVQAMAELGVDISHQQSKHINEFLPPLGNPPDLIISVCSAAEQQCPVLPGKLERLHWPFDDPANATGSDDDKLAEFRRIRDDIGSRMTGHFDL
jgi:arsenate reductase (thioredoxin)